MSISSSNTGANGWGGIFGANNNDNLYIEENMFTGTVSSGQDVGGIAGVGPRVKNCIVLGATITNRLAGSNGNVGGICGTGKIYADNNIVVNVTINGATGTDVNKTAAGICSFYQNNGKTRNCVVMGSTVIKAAATNRISGNPLASDPLVNNYASNTVQMIDPLDAPVAPSAVGANLRDGDTVAPAAMNQVWFAALGFDFTTVWAWDAANNRPKLQNVGCQESVKP
jgi:hypothetical protein